MLNLCARCVWIFIYKSNTAPWREYLLATAAHIRYLLHNLLIIPITYSNVSQGSSIKKKKHVPRISICSCSNMFRRTKLIYQLLSTQISWKKKIAEYTENRRRMNTNHKFVSRILSSTQRHFFSTWKLLCLLVKEFVSSKAEPPDSGDFLLARDKQNKLYPEKKEI